MEVLASLLALVQRVYASVGALVPLPASVHRAWAALCATQTPFDIYFFGTLAVSSGVFFGVSALYYIVDTYQVPAALLKYKTQPGKNQPLERDVFNHAFRRIAFNWLCINVPLAYFGYAGFVKATRPIDSPLPNMLEIFVNLLGCVVVEEIGFYYSHRLFHHPALYKHFHKIHHEFTAPIAVAAVYAHPVEHLIANLGPVVCGPLLCGAHIVTTWIWIALALFMTASGHSGYHLPFMPSNEAHDYHHLKFNNNYGSTGFLDWVHGTDLEYRKSVQKKRAVYLVGLTSARELVPDPVKKAE